MSTTTTTSTIPTSTISIAASKSFGTKQQQRAFWGSFIGTTLEWFDFFIYATAASLVFSTIFFPSLGEHVSLLASFATLGVAFLARPVGAFIFGHLGDTLGRRTTLMITMVLMGAATGLIGLLPTWNEIGVWAPILLTCLRFLQGVAVGGEWSGAVIMSIESAPKHRARFYGAAPQIASPFALVLSSIVMYAVAQLPTEDLMSWGWRIPFLTGFVLVVIGVIIRLRVPEPEVFNEAKKSQEIRKNPIGTVIRTKSLQLLVGVGLQASVLVLFYLITTYMLSLANQRYGIARSETMLILLVAATVDLFAIVMIGILADKISPLKIFMTGAISTLLFAIPLFLLFSTGNVVLMALAFIIALVLGHASVYAVVSSMTFELFPVEVRYSGVALVSAISAIVFSATTPFIAAFLVPAASQVHWWPLPAMLMAASLISIVAGYGVRIVLKQNQA
ncbi:MFS transporter [Advenella sp. RU8]|uniref:MFS transporter n=1 Tax=Advenella sp. RU8 TaxID=3399575 RepID=UPI003AAE470E